MTKHRTLAPGTRCRLNVAMISGYKGLVTVVFDDGHGSVEVLKDGDTLDEYGRSYCDVCRHEISVCKVTPACLPDQSQTFGSTQASS